MRTFFQFWVGEEELARNPVAKVDRAKEPDRDPPALSVAETLRLLEGCDTRTFRGQRDLMAIRLLTDTGLRREELTSPRTSTPTWSQRWTTWPNDTASGPGRCGEGQEQRAPGSNTPGPLGSAITKLFDVRSRLPCGGEGARKSGSRGAP
jgi:integrase